MLNGILYFITVMMIFSIMIVGGFNQETKKFWLMTALSLTAITTVTILYYLIA